jgi:hypothetical protein
MEPTELPKFQRRLRRAYELARLRHAFLGFLPMLLLMVVAALVGARLQIAIPAGALLFVGGVLALWYGREPSRGVLPGALAGGTALVLALCAKHMGHTCMGDHCYSWCIPACVTGGLLGGALISLVAVRQHRAFGFWVSASGITLLTGAMGCSCAGYGGVIGLVLGFGGGALLALVAAAVRRRPDQPG